MALLILNAGSSSLKFSVIDPESGRRRVDGAVDTASRPQTYTWRDPARPAVVEPVGWTDAGEALARIVQDAHSLDAVDALRGVVHRVVHGGTRFTGPVVITDEVRAALTDLTNLAPLHNPPGLDVIDAARRVLPDLPHVAVFDTAFHATLSPEAFTYPLPFDWTERWQLRRFGFHGFSHAWAARRAAALLGVPPERPKLVIAHLGNGASATAVAGGSSVETSMGFTPLEGLMMGTRSGSIDPGLVLYLQQQCGVTVDRLDQALNHESGLLGVSGVSSDMREVLEAAGRGNARAALAIRLFTRRVRQTIGAMAATLGGVDALVFTGGIGEHSAAIRDGVCDGLGWLGLQLDAGANAAAAGDAVVSLPASPGAIVVVTAREDVMMARAAAGVLA